MAKDIIYIDIVIFLSDSMSPKRYSPIWHCHLHKWSIIWKRLLVSYSLRNILIEGLIEERE